MSPPPTQLLKEFMSSSDHEDERPDDVLRDMVGPASVGGWPQDEEEEEEDSQQHDYPEPPEDFEEETRFDDVKSSRRSDPTSNCSPYKKVTGS